MRSESMKLHVFNYEKLMKDMTFASLSSVFVSSLYDNFLIHITNYNFLTLVIDELLIIVPKLPIVFYS